MTTGVQLWSTTAASNVNANIGISLDEGWAPATVNNSLRQVLADLRAQWNDAQWFQIGGKTSYLAWVYASGTTATVAGVDLTTEAALGIYPVAQVGRRVKAYGTSTGTILGYISDASFSTNTTLTFVWDSGSLSNETLTFWVSQSQVSGHPISARSISTADTATGSGNLVFATSPTLVTPVLGTPASGELSNCTVNALAPGYLGLPEVGGASKSVDYTAVLGDADKMTVFSTSGKTFTIPANGSVAYPVGTVLTVCNLSSGNISVAITSDTLTLINSTTTGTRTLAKNCLATAVKVGSTSWFIQGAGLT